MAAHRLLRIAPRVGRASVGPSGPWTGSGAKLGFGLGAGIGTGTVAAAWLPGRTHVCDGPTSGFGFSKSRLFSSGTERQSPEPPGQTKGRPSPTTVRQIAAGSLSGAIGGIIIGALSKPILFIFGLAGVVIQTLEWKGIDVMPYRRIAKSIRSWDLSAALLGRNSPFKISAAIALALTAFASLE